MNEDNIDNYAALVLKFERTDDIAWLTEASRKADENQ